MAEHNTSRAVFSGNHTAMSFSNRLLRNIFVTLLLNGSVLHSFSQEPVPQVNVTHLFNGVNLDGWYTFLEDRGRNYDPKKVFTVRDGKIRISGEEWGSITSEKEYQDYKLTLEFRWGTLTYEPRLDRARDSGLLLHSVGKDGGSQGIWMHSIEYQIIEGGTGDIIVVGDGSDQFQVTSKVNREKQGASYVFDPQGERVTISEGRINWFDRDPDWKDILGFRGKHDIETPPGEWNRIEVVAVGDELTFFLNGTLVNKATDVKPSLGKIQIQSEGAEIFIRRIEIESLPDQTL